MFFKYTLQPNESVSIPRVGRSVAGISGSARYQIQIDGGEAIPFETGLAYRSPQQFEKVILTNTHTEAQTIELALTPGEIFDTRLVGQMDLSGQIQIQSKAGADHSTPAIQNIAVGTDVLPVNGNRKSAIVQLSAPCHVDSTANGILVSGTFTWDLQTALHLVPQVGAVDVRILEELML